MTLGEGNSPVFCRSFKLKTVARSSIESELLALEEASTFAGWYTALLKEMEIGKTKEPTVIYKDNRSTIILAVIRGTFAGTKHLICKQSYVQEKIKKGDIRLMHKRTADMTADIVTKPLAGSRIEHLLQLLQVT